MRNDVLRQRGQSFLKIRASPSAQCPGARADHVVILHEFGVVPGEVVDEWLRADELSAAFLAGLTDYQWHNRIDRSQIVIQPPIPQRVEWLRTFQRPRHSV